jgi:hypothetical protein
LGKGDSRDRKLKNTHGGSKRIDYIDSELYTQSSHLVNVPNLNNNVPGGIFLQNIPDECLDYIITTFCLQPRPKVLPKLELCPPTFLTLSPPTTITWLNHHPNAIGLIAGRCGTRLIDRLLCPRASGTNILHLETTGTETAIAGDTEADHLVSLQAEAIEGISDAGIGMTEVTEITEAGATGEVRLS